VVASWSFSSASVSCPPGSYCVTPYEDPINNLVLNNFGPTVQNGHTQTIYSTYGNITVTNSILIKEDVSILYACEQTPIVFNGQPYDIIGVHPSTPDHNSNNCYIAVMSVDGVNGIVSITARDCQYPSAIVNNGTLFIYATSWGGGQTPWVFYTTDLMNWQSNQVFTSPPVVWNTSVCYDGSRYVMTMEVGSFYQSFATSPDGMNFTQTTNNELYNTRAWKVIGSKKYKDSYNYNGYTACATIRYSNGYYYLIYCTTDNGFYIERITRSPDLANWTDSTKNPMLVPDSYELAIPGCNCTSDMDLVENNGQVQIYYCVQDQSSWFNIRRAYYSGTLANFLGWFY
jgi:hypothetical protein